MKRWWIFLISLVMGTTGCSSRPHFPWSLDGKNVPAFTIATKEDVGVEGYPAYSLSIVVQNGISKEDLTLVSQKIIEELPAHNSAVIFFFSDLKEVHGPFTIGKAWWGPKDSNSMPLLGDYKGYTLKVEFK